MRFCLVSDTHEQHVKVKIPQCDILIHAGDITYKGDYNKFLAFDNWCQALLDAGTVKYEVVVIAGNHDIKLETNPEWARAQFSAATYLEDKAVVIEGFKIYGSPWQPRFYDWAFNLDRGKALRDKWALIPEDTDILVTHGPPYGIGDRILEGEHVGCVDLLERVKIVHPQLHVFGHIHEGYGMYEHTLPGTLFVNASTCTRQYKPTNPPVIVDL